MSQQSATQAHQQTKTTTTPMNRVLQRKCACGQHTVAGGECAACRKKRMNLQRQATNHAEPSSVPPIVGDVLRSPGQPLDSATRTFMEPRFGHDFSRVRVHTDAKAAESARTVNALAYTVGRDVVFGARQYKPGTGEGRQLLAHELVHVLQQPHVSSNPMQTLSLSEPSAKSEIEAEAISNSVIHHFYPAQAQKQHVNPQLPNSVVSRRVAARLTNCPANTNGAPVDPIGDLTTIDGMTAALVAGTATLLGIASALIGAGFRNPASAVDRAYQNRFGLPPARPGGFLNRLTGSVRPSLDEALSDEMRLLSRRYGLLGRFFSQFVPYRCGIPETFGGCTQTAADCAADDAGSCPGVGAIFLCPGFWAPGAPNAQATLLIHEAAHVIWARVDHGARGSGGNFRHAECYASFVGNIFGITPGGPACPVPPP